MKIKIKVTEEKEIDIPKDTEMEQFLTTLDNLRIKYRYYKSHSSGNYHVIVESNYPSLPPEDKCRMVFEDDFSLFRIENKPDLLKFMDT
jgi:hypothetical protein